MVKNFQSQHNEHQGLYTHPRVSQRCPRWNTNGTISPTLLCSLSCYLISSCPASSSADGPAPQSCAPAVGSQPPAQPLIPKAYSNVPTTSTELWDGKTIPQIKAMSKAEKRAFKKGAISRVRYKYRKCPLKQPRSIVIEGNYDLICFLKSTVSILFN